MVSKEKKASLAEFSTERGHISRENFQSFEEKKKSKKAGKRGGHSKG